ncbi:MAG: hypothetical protein C0179_01455 [Fervidicoccus sp.]|nr:MAG: hypothetical protein C0179_01455 [Fervidicoccus sp.]
MRLKYLTFTRSVSIKLDLPPQSVYEVLNRGENLLNLFPAKLKIIKMDEREIQFKMRGFGFEGPIKGKLEGRELEGEGYVVLFSATGETSVGIGVLRYKTRADFTLKFEIIPIGKATDLRIELTYSSPYEDEMIKNSIEFLNALSDRISKEIVALIPKTAIPQRPIEPSPSLKETTQVPKISMVTREVKGEVKKEEAPTFQEKKFLSIDTALSNKLGDLLFMNELLKNAKPIGTEFGVLGEDFLYKLTGSSKSASAPILINCRTAGGKLRIILLRGSISAVWGEIGGNVFIGEEALKQFYGKDVMCPLYEVILPSS